MLKPKSALLEIASAAGTITGPVLIAINWHRLPERIPVHFGFLGTPDAWGPKSFILVMPAVAIFVYLLLSHGQQRADRSHVPWKVTDQNRQQTYALVRRLLVSLKLETSIMFAFLQWAMIRVALQEAEGIGSWVAPLILVLVYGTLGAFLFFGKRLEGSV